MTNPKREKSLPWLDEVLFVQIGLPDNWLRTFLISRKRVRNLIRENTKFVGISGIILFLIIYYNPTRKQAILHNNCVSASSSIVLKKIDQKIINTENEIQAYASNFCNGGSL